jgi:hypothetical protein
MYVGAPTEEELQAHFSPNNNRGKFNNWKFKSRAAAAK